MKDKELSISQIFSSAPEIPFLFLFEEVPGCWAFAAPCFIFKPRSLNFLGNFFLRNVVIRLAIRKRLLRLIFHVGAIF